MPASSDGLDKSGKIFRGRAGFALLRGELDLKQGVDGRAALGRGGIEAFEQTWGIDRLDDVKQLAGSAGFVRLEMPDQMIASFDERSELRLLLLKFLDIILAEIAQTGLIGGVQVRSRKLLGNGH